MKKKKKEHKFDAKQASKRERNKKKVAETTSIALAIE